MQRWQRSDRAHHKAHGLVVIRFLTGKIHEVDFLPDAFSGTSDWLVPVLTLSGVNLVGLDRLTTTEEFESTLQAVKFLRRVPGAYDFLIEDSCALVGGYVDGAFYLLDVRRSGRPGLKISVSALSSFLASTRCWCPRTHFRIPFSGLLVGEGVVFYAL